MTIIPARQGAHVFLQREQKLRIINPSGHQVVDTWAFPNPGMPAWMSMAQSRQKLQRLLPTINDTFIDTRRQPILTLVEDTSSGVHDMIFPPCDEWRYAEAGVAGHDSCARNLRTELAAAIAQDCGQKGQAPLVELEERIRSWGWTPEPLNLFMNVPVGSMNENGKGILQVKRPSCKQGAYVVLRAEVDCLVVMSACPNDLLDTNGGLPGDAAYEVVE